jgi:hypothetical protein
MSKYIVCMKVIGKLNPMSYNGFSYVKAYPIDSNMLMTGVDLPTPEVDKPYKACNIITSLVRNYRVYNDGWEVETLNSIYRFFVMDMKQIEELVEKNNLNGPKRISNVSEAFYWD